MCANFLKGQPEGVNAQLPAWDYFLYHIMTR